MNTNQRTISTEDGRQLLILEAGRPEGVPVLVQGGTPNSRLLYDPWVKDAEARGIRLISYDRPGFGGSTRHSGRSIASAAKDVASIAKELGLNRLLIWGVSGGGPHALACGALLPGLVVAAAVLASPAPYEAEGLDYLAGTGEDNIALTRAALEDHAACERVVEEQAAKLLCATPATIVQALRTLLCPADVAVLNHEFAAFVLRKIREGIQETRDGWVDEEIAFVRPWGFDLSQIRVPVLLMHGGQDMMVPVSHTKWLAAKIPNVETRLLPEDGHVTLHVRRIAEVHAWLLSRT